MIELNGSIAVVTGGARDIGRAISLQLARQGASVLVNYFHNPADAESTIAAITSEGGKAVAVQGDVTKSADTDRIAQAAVDAFGGKINILINVAGGLVARKKIDEMDEAFWELVIRLNLTSVFLMTKSALPLMADGGAIVNFSSQAARDGGGPGAMAYATAKAGVLNFTRGLAKELAPRRIRVNAVSPGMINTTFHNTFTKPEVRERVASMTPLGREGEAREVAELAVFLASNSASFINGEAVEINGGIFFS